jgi:hypothetical protein
MHPANLAICTLAAAFVAGVAAAWWPDLGLAFATEQAPLAWLQASLLVACACAAGLRAALAATPRDGWGWSVLALALVAAALDERFMGHERAQDWLLDQLPATLAGAERWVQGLALVHALAGVLLLVWLRRAAAPEAWRWCRAGIVVGLGAIALDLAVDAIAPQVFEELLETLAETLFLCGLFTEARRQASRRH